MEYKIRLYKDWEFVLFEGEFSLPSLEFHNEAIETYFCIFLNKEDKRELARAIFSKSSWARSWGRDFVLFTGEEFILLGLAQKQRVEFRLCPTKRNLAAITQALVV